MDCVALEQDKDGRFSISYENGALKREKAELSWAKHNLLCFGRISSIFTNKNPRSRRGDIGNFLEKKSLYSDCWSVYVEGIINIPTMKYIIQSFNSACSRDLKEESFDDKIELTSIRKLDKNTLNFTIEVGGESSEITINI